MLAKRLHLLLIVLSFHIISAQTNELDSLRVSVEKLPQDSERVETYLQIAYLIYAGEESVLYARKALNLAKQINNKQLLGKAYHRLAWCLSLDEMDKKAAYLDSAMVQFTAINDLYGLGYVYDTRGSILTSYGSLKEGMEAYEQAYTIYTEIDNAERQAAILNNWAIAEYTAGNTKGSLLKYQKALEYRLAEKPIDHVSIARLYQGMGECYRIDGNLELAVANYLKGYDHRRTAENIGVVESMLSLASCIYEAAEKKIDTTSLVNQIKNYGFKSTYDLIETAESTRGVEDRIGLQFYIMDGKRQLHILNKDYKAAYDLLLTQKQIEEEYKLSERSLEAIADFKVKFEKDQLKIKLLEEEVRNQRNQDKMEVLGLSLGGLFLFSIVGFLYYQNRVKASQLELNEAHREQQIISMRSMLEGQEKERNRIARDLHDGLGNLLSSLKVKIGSLQINFDDKGSQKIYGTASEMIDEACSEVRKIAHEMMPQSLKKLGLPKALEDLVEKMDAIHGFNADFQMHGKETIFDDNTNVMLFRIVQEALNNVVKYAKANQVSVQLNYSANWFDLTIEDDGIGFDVNALKPNKGMGLKSMAFRTEFIGGTLDLNSRTGMGTLVTVNIPLKNIKV